LVNRSGAQHGTLFGICVQRSLQRLVGMLGILKAGGAYVPLDPAYPADRLAYMLGDAAPRVVLTQGSLVGSLPGTPATVICLDEPETLQAIGGYTQENLPAVELGL